jgi:hypothetical protein
MQLERINSVLGNNQQHIQPHMNIDATSQTLRGFGRGRGGPGGPLWAGVSVRDVFSRWLQPTAVLAPSEGGGVMSGV